MLEDFHVASWSEIKLLVSSVRKHVSGVKQQLCRNWIPAEVVHSSVEEAFPPANYGPFLYLAPISSFM